MVSASTRTLLALSHLPGLGTMRLNRIPAEVSASGLAQCADTDSAIAKAIDSREARETAIEAAERDVDTATRLNARILSPADEGYPPLLRNTSDRPALLFVRGDLPPVVERPSVAIIGTRRPTRHGAIMGDRIASHFAERGFSIVSGLAIGCDGIAHQAALDGGAHTVAVLGHGVDTITPRENIELGERILESGGALVSEYSFGVPRAGFRLAHRDRIQAGLALGVILVQSSLKGGSLHATRATLRYGRTLAFPYPSSQDIDAREENIQGVLKIADSEPIETVRFLGCEAASLRNIIRLNSKEDYPKLEAALRRPLQPPRGPSQMRLL